MKNWMQRLRAGTADCHQALDRHILLKPLSSETIHLRQYSWALAALHGPQAQIECEIRELAPSEAFPPRAPDLIADLRAMGMTPVPMRPHLLDLDRAACLGAMYVLEGSLLGAEVIARNLARHLPDAPHAYYGAQRKNARNRWAAFKQLVTAHPARNNVDGALSGARQAFDLFRVHLDSCAQLSWEEVRSSSAHPRCSPEAT